MPFSEVGWESAVVVTVNGRSTSVKTAAHARQILQSEWPFPKTEKYRRAMLVCSSIPALDGLDPSQAAFLEAVMEAGALGM